MVKQEYVTDVGQEYVIRGNSALVKCNVPSFVADFVEVQSWMTDSGDTYWPKENDYGTDGVKITFPYC